MTPREQAIKGGIASGLARQTPQLLAEKAEAIRLHVELDYGIGAITTRMKSNKGRIRRWLIAAGVYRIGHREKTRDYGQKRGPWKYRTKPITEESIAPHQRRAWLAEWVHVLPWDERNHWWLHRERRAHYWRRTALKSYSRCKTNPTNRIVWSLRHRMWKIVTTANVRKVARSMQLVGCSRPELMNHLATQFKDGMSWYNYGTAWEIDHIRPCASFDMSDPLQQRACFHFTNLQPLPVSTNRRKWSHYPVPR